MSRWTTQLASLAMAGLVVWRMGWLSAGVTDQTASADAIRLNAIAMTSEVLGVRFDPSSDTRWLLFMNQNGTQHSISPDSIAVQAWDEDAPVWIVGGADAKPGWAGWDDDRNGTIDDVSELGAAWSDDECTTAANSITESLAHRIISRGAFLPAKADDLQAVDRIQVVVRVESR